MSQEAELEYTPPYATMADFYRDVERNLVAMLDVHAVEGIAPTCRKGCDACCHQMVMTTMAEARAAAEHVAALPAAERARHAERLAAWHEQTADLRRRLQEGADEDLEELVEGLAGEYWEKRVPCPFLHEGACGIYEARPLACRHHFSVSDPELCKSGNEEVIERMEAMDDAFFFAQETIPEDEAEIGMFPELVDLALNEA